MRQSIHRTLAGLVSIALLIGVLVPAPVLSATAGAPTRNSGVRTVAPKSTVKSSGAKTPAAKSHAAARGKSTARVGAAKRNPATLTQAKKPARPGATRRGPAELRGSKAPRSGKAGVGLKSNVSLKSNVRQKEKAALKGQVNPKGQRGRTEQLKGRNGRPVTRAERATLKRQATLSRGRAAGRSGRVQIESAPRHAPRFFDPLRPQSLRAEAAVVVDTRTMKVVWAKNPHDRRPVASLTKLMTALVVLEKNVNLSDSMTVTMDDVTGAGHSHVRAGNRVAVGDLLRCSLISSDNCATRTLARSTGLTIPEFVAAMNTKARALNLRETHYADPTGLDRNNLSTAADQARLIILAADNPLISRITSSPSYTFLCGRRIECLTNTNRLLRSRGDIMGSKTGFISEAGYCLAMLIGDRDNPYLTTVVLGAPSNASRFAESSKLIEWALSVVGPTPAMASPISSGTAPAHPNQPNRR